jgi:hypothetical protein
LITGIPEQARAVKTVDATQDDDCDSGAEFDANNVNRDIVPAAANESFAEMSGTELGDLPEPPDVAEYLATSQGLGDIR